MPAEGVKLMSHNDILSIEEIVEFVKDVTPLGINKVRLTGGEPTVRKGIVDLVQKLSNLNQLTDLAMTTNGILLKQMAKDLKQAGLHRLNISLDTTDPAQYERLTRGGSLNEVFEGIEEAKKVGFKNIKINAVRFLDAPESNFTELKKFCQSHQLELRFINQMNLKTGEFSIVEGGEGGNCSICNRLRLTANGMVKPCLFSNQEYSIRQLGNVKAVEMALGNKPKSGTINTNGAFYSIGG